jgi:hypothetical protein
MKSISRPRWSETLIVAIRIVAVPENPLSRNMLIQHPTR